MTDWGMKISKTGYDVKSCSDDQLVFSSKFQTLKTEATGTINHTGIVGVAHGLPYKPIFLATNQMADGEYTLACDVFNQAGVDNNYLFLGYAWATNVMRYYLFFQEVF